MGTLACSQGGLSGVGSGSGAGPGTGAGTGTPPAPTPAPTQPGLYPTPTNAPTISPVGQPNGSPPPGFGPLDIQSAYGLTNLASNGGVGRTVALIESGGAPTLESDLAVYRSEFSLPPCTTANRCLKIIGQDGSSNLPPYDPNWGGETILDVETLSAICPNCNILVVEASNENQGLDISENLAVQMGAFAVSNSWGISPEDPSQAPYFNHPGVPITVSSGDLGYEDGAGTVDTPADLATVITVGGTSLARAGNARGWSETAWSGTGSGCSTVIKKPVWQKDAGCANRTLTDIAFLADPQTGLALYDSNSKDGPPGWYVGGGTSASAPAIAGIYALAGLTASDASSVYQAAGTGALNPVTSGSNGSCTPTYLCTAGPGYNGPTGNGTPYGAGAL